MTRRHCRSACVALVALTLVAVGCGDDDDGDATTGSAASSASDTTAAGGAAETTSGAASGGAEGDAPGVTADSVTVAFVSGTSGPFGDALKEPIAGFDVWVKEINEAGGINGRQVNIKQYDHGETADGGVAACREILDDSEVFFAYIGQGAGAHLATANCLDEQGFPNVVWQTDESLEWETTFGLFAGNARAGEVTASYIASEVTPEDKVAFAIGNADIFKATGDPMRAKAEELGVDVVDTQYLELTGTTFLPQLQKMKESGATVVALATVNIEAILMKEAATIGFEPRWIGTGYVYDYLPGGNPGLYEGVTGLSLSRTTDTPEYAEFRTVADAYGTECQTGCAQQFLFYGYGELVGAVIEAAGPEPTRETLLEGMRTKITDVELSITAPVTWSADDTVGTDEMMPALCCSDNNTWDSAGEFSNDFAATGGS